MILDRDGTPMFYCSQRRAEWYVRKNLVEVVSESPFVARLKFAPKGRGNRGDAFLLTPRKSVCVVCGSTDDLSAHHVVPKCYRRHMNKAYVRDCHDVLSLCTACHAKYEVDHAAELKEQLALEYDAPLGGPLPPHLRFRQDVGRAAHTVLRYGRHLPQVRRDELLEFVAKYLGHYPNDDDLRSVARELRVSRGKWKTHGRKVVERVDSLESLIRLWRMHFVQTMQPQYMPDHWNVMRPVRQDEPS